jgi:hypothetical protein
LLKNAAVIPEEIALKKEIETLKELRQKTPDRQETARLTREINLKTTRLNLLLERNRR